MPELPDAKLERFQKEYTIPAYDAEILTREKSLANYFEEAAKVGQENKVTPKEIANTIINKKIAIEQTSPAALIKQIVSGKQTVQIDEKELKKLITEVISENEKAVEDYKKGKEASLMFILGQVMRKLGRKADTKIILHAITEQLA